MNNQNSLIFVFIFAAGLLGYNLVIKMLENFIDTENDI